MKLNVRYNKFRSLQDLRTAFNVVLGTMKMHYVGAFESIEVL